MCGISGMLGHPDITVVHRMINLIQHRGPDGQDFWSDDYVALGHSRLAIVDLNGSRQPMRGINGQVLVANGEIYNHKEIRNKSKYPWQTNGDSESIIALHDTNISSTVSSTSANDHIDWISKLNGMYAFALWDLQRQELILARDPMGIKPLVRTMVDGSLLFGSEVKALRGHEGHIPQIDETALAVRLAWEYPLDGTTLLKDVTQVRPGTVEVWKLNNSGNAFLHSIANVERQTVTPSESWNPDIDAEYLLDTFVEGVQERLMSDVPVGIVLSGGLDSSLVAAVAHEAAKRANQPVPACWTVAESEDNPDWKAAEVVASTLDLKHHQYVLPEDSFDSTLPDLAWHGEDLDVSVLFFQPLFQKMREQVTVGLCGQGADELHAGYPRYRDLGNHAKIIRSRIQSIDSTVTAELVNSNLPVGENWYLANHMPEQHTSSLDEFLQFELEHGQLSNFQLRLVDRHSMAHSLEVRVPFLGKSHREASSKLPLDWRLPSNMEEKAALRAAADLTNLPKDIVRRPKLPAGTATSPSLLKNFLSDLKPRGDEICKRFPKFAKVLEGQPELAIGLGLFEAMHILDGGRSMRRGSTSELLDEVI
ncbi:MAG: asparagine synthase (glutamine-hydrolyzing) [Candidatus Poseidoniaceae archaeon]|nr:asparagine synthase (glutamine-hydrolyzing) [Candidatus Poseidoniaceae archaeon]